MNTDHSVPLVVPVATAASATAVSPPGETSTLRVQVASDLHIEFYGDQAVPDDIIIPRAPVLALLGDIGLACTHSLRAFLLRQTERFETVLFLAGNHEYYNHGSTTYSITEQTSWMKRVCAERSNLHFLERDALFLNGVLVCGTTLWSEIPDELVHKAEMSLNDYVLSYNHRPGMTPRKLTARETRNEHRTSVRWLESKLEEARGGNVPVLVLTHHTPLMRGTSHPRHEGSDEGCCFSSDLRRLLIPPVTAWACGHTHYNFDICVGNRVSVVSNQRGYPHSLRHDYDPEGLVLEISSSKAR